MFKCEISEGTNVLSGWRVALVIAIALVASLVSLDIGYSVGTWLTAGNTDLEGWIDIGCFCLLVIVYIHKRPKAEVKKPFAMESGWHGEWDESNHGDTTLGDTHIGSSNHDQLYAAWKEQQLYKDIMMSPLKGAE